jgi:hypothetical protein
MPSGRNRAGTRYSGQASIYRHRVRRKYMGEEDISHLGRTGSACSFNVSAGSGFFLDAIVRS